jgi:hypothetical protein
MTARFLNKLYWFETRRGREDTDRCENENFYYACIHDIQQDQNQQRENTSTLNHLKAKIVKLHSKQLQSIIIDAHEPTIFRGESLSHFHLLQRRKRRESWLITSVLDESGDTQTTMRDILNDFVVYLKRKHCPIHVDDKCVAQMGNAGHRTVLTG